MLQEESKAPIILKTRYRQMYCQCRFKSLVKCEEYGRNISVMKNSLFFLDDRGILSSLSVSKLAKGLTANMHYFKEIDQVAQFFLKRRCVYVLNEEGLLLRMNQSNGKVRYRQQLENEEGNQVFTALFVLNDCIIAASNLADVEETTSCTLQFLTKKRRLFKKITFQSKSFKRAKADTDGSLYDPNPVHCIKNLSFKHLTIVLVANFAFSIHILALDYRRVTYISNNCLARGNNGVICGITTKENTALIFGWRSMLFRLCL